jgi:hypothetical protein
MVDTSSTANEREDMAEAILIVVSIGIVSITGTIVITVIVFQLSIFIRSSREKRAVLRREGERIRNDRAAWDMLTDKERNQFFDESCGEERR